MAAAARQLQATVAAPRRVERSCAREAVSSSCSENKERLGASSGLS